MGAPLSPSEISRRAEVAAADRVANGALHQDEPAAAAETWACADDCTHPAHRHVTPQPLPSRIEPEIAPTDVWVMTETGLRRWRPIIDQLTVTPLPNGERILDIGGHRLRLNKTLAAHVARLLYPAIDPEGA
jgi:hypothetical protein